MKLPFEVWVLSLISFMSAVGLGLVAPSLPALATEFGVGVTAISVAVSGFAAARLVTTLGLTRALRSVRLRPVLAAGLGFQAVTTIIAGLAPDYTLFIAFRCLSGVGSAAFSIASTALLVALAPPDRRGRAMSVYGGASGIGIVSGPAIGGALALAEPHLPLIVYGAGLGLGCLVTIFLLRSARDLRTIEEVPATVGIDPAALQGEGPAALPRRRGALGTLLRDPLFLTVVACQVVHGWVHYGLRIAILPSYLEMLGHGLAFVGIGLAVAAGTQLAATTTGGTISDRIGRKPVLLLAFAAALAGIAMFVVAVPPWVVIVAFVALGLGGGAQASASSALLADSRNGRTAAAAGVYWMTFDIAAIVGPVTTGLLVEFFGAPWALGAGALVIVIAAIAAFRIPGTRTPAPAS
jgi:MFS family permease